MWEWERGTLGVGGGNVGEYIEGSQSGSRGKVM